MTDKTENIRKWFLFSVAFSTLLGALGGGIFGYTQTLDYADVIDLNSDFRIAHKAKHTVHDEYQRRDSGVKVPHG